MKRENKTNAARLLDRAGIAYELNTYPVDENDLSAIHVAESLGVDAGALYKTLVLRGDRTGIFVCVVPGDAEVDLKKAARASGNKKADLVPVKELLPLTGYVRGGCSPMRVPGGGSGYTSVPVSGGYRLSSPRQTSWLSRRRCRRI